MFAPPTAIYTHGPGLRTRAGNVWFILKVVILAEKKIKQTLQ
jgi:hypothetical protein